MTANLAFYLSIAILLIACICAYTWRKRLSFSIRWVTLGVFLALLVLNSVVIESESLTQIFFTVQMGLLEIDYQELFQQIPREEYKFFILYSILVVLAPVVVGGTFVSFFDRFVSPLTFFLYRNIRNCYFFYELNEHTFQLAKDISSNDKKALIIFSHIRSENEDLLDEAKSLSFIFHSSATKKQWLSQKFKRYYFYLTDNQARNLSLSLKLLEKLQEKIDKQGLIDTSLVKIFVHVNSEEDELLLNSVEKSGIEMVVVNTCTMTALFLMSNIPLYTVLDGQTEARVLIVGAGATGCWLVRMMMHCGQLGSNYSVNIQVIDRLGNYICSRLKRDYPELFSQYKNIEFIEGDVDLADFHQVLEKKSVDRNYIVVALDDDRHSVEMSLYLRRFYNRRILLGNSLSSPLITTRIRSNTVADNFRGAITSFQNKKSLWDEYNIIPFGSDNEIYSYQQMIDNPLDKLALNAHAVYYLNKEFPPEQRERLIRESYCANETSRRSDKANVTHIFYKLFIWGYLVKPYDEASEKERSVSSENVKELQEFLYNEEFREEFGILEHDRWMAFQRSEGWQYGPPKKNEEGSVVYKFPKEKIHACICPWDDLTPEMKQYDIDFVRYIPDILGLTDNPKINLSKIKYVLLKKTKGKGDTYGRI